MSSARDDAVAAPAPDGGKVERDEDEDHLDTSAHFGASLLVGLLQSNVGAGDSASSLDRFKVPAKRARKRNRKYDDADGDGATRASPSTTSTETGEGGREQQATRRYHRPKGGTAATWPTTQLPLAQRLRELQVAAAAGGGVPAGAAASAPSDLRPTYTFRRLINNATYLSRMHVGPEFAKNVLPEIDESVFNDDDDDATAASAATAAPAAKDPSTPSSSKKGATQNPTSKLPNRLFFRARLRLLDSSGREFLSTYESLRSSGQKHTRLSGLNPLAQANNFRVGDVMLFRLYGVRGKLGGDGGGPGEGGEEGLIVVERERGDGGGGERESSPAPPPGSAGSRGKWQRKPRAQETPAPPDGQQQGSDAAAAAAPQPLPPLKRTKRQQDKVERAEQERLQREEARQRVLLHEALGRTAAEQAKDERAAAVVVASVPGVLSALAPSLATVAPPPPPPPPPAVASERFQHEEMPESKSEETETETEERREAGRDDVDAVDGGAVGGGGG